MFLLGLLLAACSGAFAALLIAFNLSGAPQYTVRMFGTDMVTLGPLSIFCSGLALALLFSLGMAMLGGKLGMHRSRKTRDHRAVESASHEREMAQAREEVARSRERAARAEARADRMQHQGGGGRNEETVWSADQAPERAPGEAGETRGAHRPDWNK